MGVKPVDGTLIPQSPLQPIIKPVDREEIEAALKALENVDLDAANKLRARLDAYHLFAYEPWEIKDLLLSAAYRTGQLQVACKELADKFDRLARGECMDDSEDAPENERIDG